MNILLNIDTAVDLGSIALTENGQLLHMRLNENSREHASWIHDNIAEMLRDAKISMKEIVAVAVSNGPGSYTGLRIGLSTAKGLCYALKIPLITLSTLEIMANAVLNKAGKYLSGPGTLLCPMIDARRMEVYTAVYNMQMQEVKKATALILEERSYGELLDQHRIVFSGNGSIKWKKLCSHNNAFFADEVVCTAADMANLSYEYYKQKNFSLPSLAEPFYLKDFYTVTPR